MRRLLLPTALAVVLLLASPALGERPQNAGEVRRAAACDPGHLMLCIGNEFFASSHCG